MDLNFLLWALGIIAATELIVILLLVRLLRKRSVYRSVISARQTIPNMDYEIRQIDNWTKLYFSNHHHSKKEIGKMYERYIGFLKEQEGYSVEYHGINFRHKDSGIDLVCKRDNEVLLVQCKRLSHLKVIHEDILNKLRGSLEEYKAKTENDNVKAEVCASSQFAEDSINAAKIHNIKISVIPFDSEYPSIKCNISKGLKHFFPIYHPLYDRISINPTLGECYCKTAEEAYQKGFQPVKIRWIDLFAAKRKIGLSFKKR